MQHAVQHPMQRTVQLTVQGTMQRTMQPQDQNVGHEWTNTIFLAAAGPHGRRSLHAYLCPSSRARLRACCAEHFASQVATHALYATPCMSQHLQRQRLRPTTPVQLLRRLKRLPRVRVCARACMHMYARLCCWHTCSCGACMCVACVCVRARACVCVCAFACVRAHARMSMSM